MDKPLTAADTLGQWLAEEARQRAVFDAGAGPGAVPPAQALAMDGLALMQAMLRGEVPYAPIAQTLDFLLLEVGPGRAVFQGQPLERHYNPMGTVHGGWYATLLDSALGCAVAAALPRGKAYTTLELKLNMIRALTPRVARVRAIGEVIHVGGQTATAEARLLGPDGRLYGHASTTCLVFEPRAAA